MSATISKKVTIKASSILYANITLTYSESATDITNNQSTISWSVKAAQVASSICRFTGHNRTNAATIKVYVNGSCVLSQALGLTSTPSSWTKSGTTKVTHNSDGTKTITVQLQIISGTGNYTNDPWVYGSASGSASLTLKTLPRVSGISCGALTMGTAGTIKIDRKASSFTDTITYSFGSASGTVCTKTSSTSVSFTPPLSLGSQIPKATTGTMILTVTTYSGSTKVGSKSISVKISIPGSVVPTLTSITASAVNGDVPSSWGIYVQGKSKATLKINGAAGAYGSTITGYSISGGGFSGSSSSLTTGFLNTSGKITFTAKVTDSRGRTSAAKTVSITVVSYAAPSISAYSLERCTADGAESDAGTCVLGNVTFAYASCSSKNTIKTSVKYKKSSDTDWTDAGTTFKSATNFVFGSAKISTESTYDILLSITDTFGTVSVTGTVSTAAVVMDFKAGGAGVAVGKVSEKSNAFEVNSSWNAYFHGSEIKTLINSLISAKESEILLKAYPVGSIYLSISSTNPGKLFGGTWVQIAGGRFLLGQSSDYAVKATGGEAKHTLALNEIPSHVHCVNMNKTSAEADGYGLTTAGTFKNRVLIGTNTAKWSTSSKGGGGAHNNMPPYYVCYMWERTA